MAKNPTGSSADRLPHPLLEKFGEMQAAAQGLFVYSVKIVCGKQTGTDCCCIAGARPGLYATEVNIQNLNIGTAQVVKFVQPLINMGAVVAREPDVTDPKTIPLRQIEDIILPPLAATMDDCCRIAEMLLGAPPSGDTGLTIANPDDREPVRAVRLRGLHGEPSERGRHQHRRRVRSVATSGTSWPRLTECDSAGGWPTRSANSQES